MTTIKFFEDALLVEGHSNYAQEGLDIICAGISAITQGSLNWFDKEDVEIKISDGFLLLIIKNKTKKNLYLLNLIKIQLSALDANEYRVFLKFITKNKNYNTENKKWKK